MQHAQASQILCSNYFDGLAHHSESCQLQIREGRIQSLEQTSDIDDCYYWCPGFINLHTHLELSALRNQLPRQVDFPKWVDALRQHTSTWSPEDYTRSFQQGLQEAWIHGTTAIYDVGNACEPPNPRTDAPELWAMREVLGLTEPGAPPEGPVVPHALYSTHPNRIRQAIRSCYEAKLPWTLHIAESEAEQQVLTQGKGPFRTWLDHRIPHHPFCGPGQRPLARLLEILGSDELKSSQGILVHGNYFDESELTCIARQGWALVHCPESRAWFGHTPPNWQLWKTTGVDICVASDSLASALNLDLRAQLRELRNSALGLFTNEELLRFITANPGKHLGERGRIAPNYFADLVCLRLPEGANPSRMPEAVLDPATRVRSVWRNGKETLIDKDA